MFLVFYFFSNLSVFFWRGYFSPTDTAFFSRKGASYNQFTQNAQNLCRRNNLPTPQKKNIPKFQKNETMKTQNPSYRSPNVQVDNLRQEKNGFSRLVGTQLWGMAGVLRPVRITRPSVSDLLGMPPARARCLSPPFWHVHTPKAGEMPSQKDLPAILVLKAGSHAPFEPSQIS